MVHARLHFLDPAFFVLATLFGSCLHASYFTSTFELFNINVDSLELVEIEVGGLCESDKSDEY
jgi:hypothetical protein